MFLDYVQWQYVFGPLWLVKFFITMQRALWRLFSVPLMIKTFISPWHRDQVAVRSNSLPGVLRNIAWNSISRGIGAIVRFTVIVLWVGVECIYIPFAFSIISLFLIWPLVVIVGLAISGGLLIYGS